jgi:monoterpene epsilon-lactone hydrolase
VSIRTTIIKKLVARLMTGWSEGPIEAQRARQEKQIRYIPLPTDIQCQPANADGVSVEWIAAPGADSGVMMYLHGGAYALGSINTARELAARLARATNTRALAVDYRLAPEHPYPAAVEDALTVYRWLLKEVAPSRIVIAGDSAGGGLTLATLMALRDAGEPLPAGAVCLSPWTDLALTGDSIESRATADPILDSDSLAMYARYYAGERELSAPLLSPLYADFRGLPPLLIQVGTEEILLDDAVRCAKSAREAEVDVTLEIWDEMFHVFQTLPFLRESKRAAEHIAEFVSRRFTATT